MKKVKKVTYLPLFSIFFIAFCFVQCKKADSNIWLGAEQCYKGSGITSNAIILDLNKSEAFQLPTLELIDSIHIKDSFIVNRNKWIFKKKTEQKIVYKLEKDTNWTLSFRKLEKLSPPVSFNKILSQQWGKTISKQGESFDIEEQYVFDSLKLNTYRYYFLQGKELYKEREQHNIDTLNYGGQQFLVFKNNSSLLNQIKKLSANELVLFCHNSYYGHDIKYKKITIKRKKREDLKDFKVCNVHNIIQYYYNGITDGMIGENKRNKTELLAYFKEYYQPPIDATQNGYIRIRFIVNCRGETGRFSIQEMDREYKEKQFPFEMTEQLFKLTTRLDGWLPKKWGRIASADYYIHIGFKIKNGQIDEIIIP